MLKKLAFLMMLVAIAGLSTACVSSFLDSSDDAAVETEGTEENADADAAVDAEAEADDPAGTDLTEGDLPNIELPAGITEEQAEVMVANAIVGDVPPEVEDCVSLKLLTEPTLFIALVGAGDDFVLADLDFDDQVRLSEITIDCAGPELMGQFIAEGFADGSDMEAPPEMIDCFVRHFNGDDGPLIAVGFAALGEELAPEEPAKGPLIDALTECVPGSVMADAFIDGAIAEDPTFAAAIDTDCVADGYSSDPELIRPFWTEFVEQPQADFTDLSPETTTTLFTPLFGCISFGSVLAAQGSGVDISQSSIDCIDTELADIGFWATIIAGGEPDEVVLQGILLECLTAEELLGLGGA